MGFLNNFADEFGAKTGKALGNKLFGKHADDYRIGFGESEQSGGGATKRDLELAELEAKHRLDEMEAAELQALKQEIKMITFSSTNLEENFNKLDNLLPYLEMDPEDCGEDMAVVVKAAQSKFKSGMVVCKNIDPNNPVIQYLESEQNERKEKLAADIVKKKKGQKKAIIVLLILLLSFGLLALLLGS